MKRGLVIGLLVVILLVSSIVASEVGEENIPLDDSFESQDSLESSEQDDFDSDDGNDDSTSNSQDNSNDDSQTNSNEDETDDSEDDNAGHGNNDGCDPDNPGNAPFCNLDEADDDSEENEEECITICHKPGTPAEKTMEIPESALDGHLGHGDYIGECQDDDEADDAEDEENDNDSESDTEDNSNEDLNDITGDIVVDIPEDDSGDGSSGHDYVNDDVESEEEENIPLLNTNKQDIDPIAEAGPKKIISKKNIVVFDGSKSVPGLPEDPISLYIWDFGDGNSESGALLTNPVHIYNEPGIYTVKLTVFDQDSSNMDTVIVEVKRG